MDLDRMLRENFEGMVMKAADLAALPFPFNYKVVGSFYTPNISKTLEKKLDFAKIIEDNTAEHDQSVLHIEFQTEDDKRMVVRMQFYLAMIQDGVALPVKQYVIYLGEQPAKMATHMRQYIPGNTLDYHYELIEIRKYDADVLLAADIPEVIVLAILAARGNTSPYNFVVKVLKRLKAVCRNKAEVDKFVLQLVSMSSLRNLDEVIKHNKDDLAMSTGISIRDNAVFKGMFHEGELERARKAAMKMLSFGKLSDEEIIEYTELSQQELEELKQQLS